MYTGPVLPVAACSVRSFLVERFEELVHDEFGGKVYWDVSGLGVV